jgi:predicted nuclease of predicted toxin-antitoxin system
VIVWVDAQLSPALAPWLTEEFGVEAYSVRYLSLLRAKDPGIFQKAREANVAVMTKDVDFVLLQDRFGAPPIILWVRCGNTSNAHLKEVLRRTFPHAQKMIGSGEILVEIADAP